MSEGESGLREKREEGDEVGKIDSVTVVLFSRLSTVKSTGNSFREGTGIDSRGSNFYGSPNGVNIVSFSVDFCVMLATAVSLFLWTHVRTHTHTHTRLTHLAKSTATENSALASRRAFLPLKLTLQIQSLARCLKLRGRSTGRNIEWP